jgi:hypothetical protein
VRFIKTLNICWESFFVSYENHLSINNIDGLCIVALHDVHEFSRDRDKRILFAHPIHARHAPPSSPATTTAITTGHVTIAAAIISRLGSAPLPPPLFPTT